MGHWDIGVLVPHGPKTDSNMASLSHRFGAEMLKTKGPFLKVASGKLT
jgi:hypothetical protein